MGELIRDGRRRRGRGYQSEKIKDDADGSFDSLLGNVLRVSLQKKPIRAATE